MERDLGDVRLWERSLERSQRRRALAAARGRTRVTSVHVSAALLTATVVAPVGTAVAQGTTLRHGSEGEAVAAVQRALGIPADGVYGPVTRRAVRAFQSAHGLVADGIVGPATARALGLGGASAPSSSTTAAIQRALGIPADGVFGPVTERAVRAFQAAHGLEVDGVVGPVTARALGLGGGAPTPAKPAGEGTTAALQRALGLPADGVYGPNTRAAVRQFQAAHGLAVDGVAGPATLAALGVSGGGGGGGGSALAAVRSQIGTPYALGGEAPGGFDCSGLVQWAFAQAGVRLPRTSFQQFSIGTPVSRAAIQAGDLVFFNTDGAGASHVGIATSNASVISATTHGVREHPIDGDYWGAHYVGARRV